jgi:hypothetical protein
MMMTMMMMMKSDPKIEKLVLSNDIVPENFRSSTKEHIHSAPEISDNRHKLMYIFK